MVFILKKFFDQIPIELEDAARIDGAGRLRVFWSIVLPLSRPILAAVAIFVFIGGVEQLPVAVHRHQRLVAHDAARSGCRP